MTAAWDEMGLYQERAEAAIAAERARERDRRRAERTLIEVAGGRREKAATRYPCPVCDKPAGQPCDVTGLGVPRCHAVRVLAHRRDGSGVPLA